MSREDRCLTFVRTRYQPNTQPAPGRLAGQVSYIARAPLFTSHLAPLDMGSARGLIAAHALAPAWPGPVAFHRMLLSLPSTGTVAHQVMMRALCTVAMNDLGAILDRRLVWLAGVHVDTDNLHAHVLIAGGDLRGRPVSIRPPALAAFKTRLAERARP